MNFNIVCADDEAISLRRLKNICLEIDDKLNISTFENPYSVIEFAKSNKIDIAFLDIDMPTMTGINLARELKKIDNNIKVIMTTAYTQYAFAAYQQDCFGYLLKPIRKDDVFHQLTKISSLNTPTTNNKVCVKCFGDFDISFNGNPLPFHLNKAKELVAYLVDRQGAIIDNKRIASVIWDDDNDHTNYFKSLQNELKEIANSIPFPIFIFEFGKIGLITQNIDCDYWNYLQNNDNSFLGEYMEQYSWAEDTKAMLLEKKL